MLVYTSLYTQCIGRQADAAIHCTPHSSQTFIGLSSLQTLSSRLFAGMNRFSPFFLYIPSKVVTLLSPHSLFQFCIWSLWLDYSNKTSSIPILLSSQSWDIISIIIRTSFSRLFFLAFRNNSTKWLTKFFSMKLNIYTNKGAKKKNNNSRQHFVNQPLQWGNCVGNIPLQTLLPTCTFNYCLTIVAGLLTTQTETQNVMNFYSCFVHDIYDISLIRK